MSRNLGKHGSRDKVTLMISFQQNVLFSSALLDRKQETLDPPDKPVITYHSPGCTRIPLTSREWRDNTSTSFQNNYVSYVEHDTH